MGKTRPPSFLPIPATIVLCLLFAAALPAGGGELESRQPAWVEPDVDRPGSDFKILWLRGGPEACQEACAQNPLCRSYTYVRAGAEGRMEGCWLKDGVPSPVEDRCCVSGVKTGDTVTLAIREPAIPADDAAKKPVEPVEEAAVRKPQAKKTARPEDRVPATGSGRRGHAGMNFAAVPPRDAEGMRSTLILPIPPGAREAGAGRRRKTGMNFSAVPPMAAARPAPAPALPKIPVATTGTGRREIRGVHYSASPMTAAKDDRTGAATRKVTGVDITAIPPPRR